VRVQIDIPDEIVSEFSEVPGGISRAAVEALALEGVRSGRLTEHQARVMLGIATRDEMDGFLKSHKVFLPDTLESVIRDSETAGHFLRR
jgi:Uncharacterised protein family (UPF0175)